MSWAAAGVAVGVAGVASSAYGAKKAGDAAQNAAEYQAQADAERLAFEREQYDEWQDTYGGLEDNLAKYYEQLTPTLRTMQGLQAFEKEKQVAMDNLRTNMAQRGISTSGIAAQTNTAMAISSAEERARIRAAAPMEVAKEQSSFLQIGLGQDPSAGLSSAYGDQATNANRLMRDTAAASGQATQAFTEAVTDLTSDYISYKKSTYEPEGE